jgi:hypothetical protein
MLVSLLMTQMAKMVLWFTLTEAGDYLVITAGVGVSGQGGGGGTVVAGNTALNIDISIMFDCV